MSKWRNDPTPGHEQEGRVETIRCRREERGDFPTQYEAPEKDQKWRARNVISFHFRHLNYKAPSAYRDVLLCAIDHANPTTGRCDIGQRKIGRECNLSRQTVNEAMRWWEENTYYLKVETRVGRTNAYHILWDNLEVDWREIQERIGVTDASRVTRGVNTDPTGGVGTDPTGGVNTDPTLTLNKNLKGEPQHEMAHPPSAADATQREKEKGLSGKGKADSLREPSNSQDAAIAAVKKYLRDPFVTANLPSLEAIETAVAAELVEAGSGRKIIQSAANDTWKAKRTA